MIRTYFVMDNWYNGFVSSYLSLQYNRYKRYLLVFRNLHNTFLLVSIYERFAELGRYENNLARYNSQSIDRKDSSNNSISFQWNLDLSLSSLKRITLLIHSVTNRFSCIPIAKRSAIQFLLRVQL